jgi:hypothetical protein
MNPDELKQYVMNHLPTRPKEILMVDFPGDRKLVLQQSSARYFEGDTRTLATFIWERCQMPTETTMVTLTDEVAMPFMDTAHIKTHPHFPWAPLNSLIVTPGSRFISFDDGASRFNIWEGQARKQTCFMWRSSNPTDDWFLSDIEAFFGSKWDSIWSPAATSEWANRYRQHVMKLLWWFLGTLSYRVSDFLMVEHMVE